MNNREWFKQAKYGMFIHWGLYSIPAGVWQGNKGNFGESNAVNYAEHIQLRHNIPPEESRAITELVHRHQPNCLVNSRVGGEAWDYRSLGDNEISDEPLDEPWETCMTMNDSWGYHQLDHNWKSTETIVRHFVDIVSKGGVPAAQRRPDRRRADSRPEFDATARDRRMAGCQGRIGWPAYAQFDHILATAL